MHANIRCLRWESIMNTTQHAEDKTFIWKSKKGNEKIKKGIGIPGDDH